jgi:MFS family permease
MRIEERRAGAADLGVRELAVVGGAGLAISTIAFFRVPLLPSIGRDLALSPTLLSLFTVVFGVGRLLADVPAGRIADRFAPARGLAIAGIVTAVGSFLLSTSGSYRATLAAAAVIGVGSALGNTIGMTFFSQAPPERRGASMAVFSAALLGGQSLGPAFAGLLTVASGWRAAEATAGFGAIAVAAACLALGRRVETAHTPVPAGDEGGVHDARLAGSVRVLLYIVPFAVFFALGAMPQTVVPLIAAHGYGFSAGMIGLALGFGGVCRFAGAAVGGYVSDRLGRKAALIPGLALMAGGIIALDLHAGAALLVAAITAMSLGSYGVTVGATMLADLSGRGARGRRLGGFRFAGDGGLIVGPLVAGFLYDRFGTGASVFAVAGVLLACAVAAAVVLPETLPIRIPRGKRLL